MGATSSTPYCRKCCRVLGKSHRARARASGSEAVEEQAEDESHAVEIDEVAGVDSFVCTDDAVIGEQQISGLPVSASTINWNPNIDVPAPSEIAWNPERDGDAGIEATLDVAASVQPSLHFDVSWSGHGNLTIDIYSDATLGDLKTLLASRTGVPIGRQKVLGFKPARALDTVTLSSLTPPRNGRLMFVGSLQEELDSVEASLAARRSESTAEVELSNDPIEVSPITARVGENAASDDSSELQRVHANSMDANTTSNSYGAIIRSASTTDTMDSDDGHGRFGGRPSRPDNPAVDGFPASNTHVPSSHGDNGTRDISAPFDAATIALALELMEEDNQGANRTSHPRNSSGSSTGSSGPPALRTIIPDAAGDSFPVSAGPATCDSNLANLVLCIVCDDEAVRTCLIPCGHVILCSGCASKLNPRKCPMCRLPIEHVVETQLRRTQPLTTS